MLGHVLAILDLIVAGIMVGGHYGLFHVILIYAALYLIGKLIFWRDVLTIIDVVAGLYILFMFFGHASSLTWVFLAYFLYKFSVWAFMTFTL